MKRFGAVSTFAVLALILAAQAGFGADAAKKRLNLNLKQVPFPEVIRSIFSGSGDRFTVDPALSGLRVSATLKNVTREEAIRVVTKSAGVTYSVKGNAYRFSPDSLPSSVQKTDAQSTAPPVPKGPAKVDVITLQYITAGDAAQLLNAAPPDGLETITATSVNTLMLKGTGDSTDQAKLLVKLFDVESALPRSVRVQLSLDISGAGLEKPMELASESVGPEGTSMPLSINFSSENVGSLKLDLQLTPSVLPDGSVSLFGSGGIDCVRLQPYHRLNRVFDVAASVTPGTPTVVASGSGDTPEGAIGFTARATVTVDKGRIVVPRGGRPGSSPSVSLSRQDIFSSAAAVSKPDDTHRRIADALLKQIWDAEPGQAKFDAIDAVARKYVESDLATRNAIVGLSINYMKDKRRGAMSRWPCCYVISRCGYEPGIADLIEVLRKDEMEVMRAVAAEALGALSDHPAARDALVQAKRNETNTRVREVLDRYLKADSQ